MARAGCGWRFALVFALAGCWASAVAEQGPGHPIVLHGARLLEVDTGRILTPGEILVEGERISAVGSSVSLSPFAKCGGEDRCFRQIHR